MADNKKIIYFYADWITVYEALSDEEAGQLIKCKFRYVNDLELKAPNRLIELLFKPFQIIFKRDLKLWNKSKENKSRAGKLGYQAKLDKQKEALLSDAKQKTLVSSVKDKVKDKEINNNNYSEICLKDKQWLEITSMQNKGKNIKELLSKFDKHLITISEQKKDIKQYKQHFINWLAKQPKGSASKINLGI